MMSKHTQTPSEPSDENLFLIYYALLFTFPFSHSSMHKVPPNILDIESTPSSVAVRENQNINMTCRADGFPTPKIIWRREDGQSITVERKKKVMVYDGEILHLTKLSRNEVIA